MNDRRKGEHYALHGNKIMKTVDTLYGYLLVIIPYPVSSIAIETLLFSN